MFKQIQYWLLISYLIVLSIILGGFAIAVRVVFARSLTAKVFENLTALGAGAALSIEIDNGKWKTENDGSTQSLIIQKQALQRFDA